MGQAAQGCHTNPTGHHGIVYIFKGRATAVHCKLSARSTSQFSILYGVPFLLMRSCVCKTGFSAVAVLKGKYRAKLSVDQEEKAAIPNLTPSFERLFSA